MVYLIILVAALTRFVPHMPNLAPVTALAIFGAVYLPKKQALVIPLAVRLLSDLFLGFFSWPLMIAVYAAHLIGFGLGLLVKKHSVSLQGKFLGLTGAGMLSAIIFFLITNFAFFYSATEYTHNLSGILLAYYNGLPFFQGTLIGDVVYTLVLAGSYEAVKYFVVNRTNQKHRNQVISV